MSKITKGYSQGVPHIQFPRARIHLPGVADTCLKSLACFVSCYSISCIQLVHHLKRQGADVLGLLGDSGQANHLQFAKDLELTLFDDLSHFDRRKTYPVLLRHQSWLTKLQKIVEQGAHEIFLFPVFFPEQSQRTVIVCNEAKSIFLPVYKSLYSSFREYFRNGFEEFADCPKLSHGLNSNEDLLSNCYDDFFKFSIVRNPFHRFVSFFRDKLNSEDNAVEWRMPLVSVLDCEPTFELLAQLVCCVPDSHTDPHWRSQHATLNIADGSAELCDYVGRFENIRESTSFIANKIGSTVLLEHKNKSPGPSVSYDDYYNKETRELIKARYEKDLEKYYPDIVSRYC